MFDNIINAFTGIFDQFKVPLLNKSIHLYIKKILLTPNFWLVRQQLTLEFIFI